MTSPSPPIGVGSLGASWSRQGNVVTEDDELTIMRRFWLLR
jgi:hypothetical protein